MRRKSCINLAKKFKPPLLGLKATSDIIKKDISFLRLDKESEDEFDISKTSKHLKKMSNDQLKALLSSQDNFVIDRLLDQTPMVCMTQPLFSTSNSAISFHNHRKLTPLLFTLPTQNHYLIQLKVLNREHGTLTKQVNDLANFNYAREPEFVRNRLKLRDTLDEVATLRRRVTKHLQPILNKLEVAKGKLSASAILAEEESEQVALSYLKEGSTSQDAFIELYVKLRKEAHEKRILADKLTKEKDMLANHIPKPLESNSPIPTPRQRKRVSFNK